ncbi:hypothetical protein ONA70_18470 [Micromonospora yasonensis]|nr:hypothetical protein [Micromonospora yasonensis]MCW3842087.1 hypothetical protein [Micromonospora yasonensis]
MTTAHHDPVPGGILLVALVDPERAALRAGLGDAAPATRVLEVRDV